MAALRSLTPLLTLTLVLGVIGFPRSTYAAAATLTNCLDILKLSPTEANENRPARLRGTVTCYVPSSQLCFVQDGTAGLYIFPSPWPKDLAAGDVVEVEGVSSAGRFSPIVQWARIQRTSERAQLEPRRIAIEELNTGRYDCQFIEIEGVVQKTQYGPDLITMQIVTGGSSASALIFDKITATNHWIDARVRLRGVAGTLYNGDQLSGFGIFLADHSSVTVLDPPANLFSGPLRTTRKLAWFSTEGAFDHRITLRGLVTVSWPGEAFFLQDDAGQIRVALSDSKNAPAPGDLVEVAGFARDVTSETPLIVGAAWRKVGTATVPPAKPALLSEVLQRPADGQLIALEAQVIGYRTNASVSALVLEASGHIISAVSQTPFSNNLARSTIRVSGALSSAPSRLKNESGPCIWLASADHLTVLQRPGPAAPTPAEVIPGALLALAALAATAVLAIGAVAWRSRSNARQAAAQNHSIAERLDLAEKELTQLKDARERLGRDLHDHIIQSIYAVGLNIEDCRQMLTDPAVAESRLRTTLTDINAVIRELRNVILGLETNAIQPQEFRTALKSLALTLGAEKSNRIRLDLDHPAVDLLTAVQATEIIHLAREALSNSVRHGRAETTTLSLHNLEQSIRFTVDDDGCGFDPATTESTGYGLRNMAKRAEDIGAKFTVHSQKGAGTRIVLDIPKQKQHFSNSESRSRINR